MPRQNDKSLLVLPPCTQRAYCSAVEQCSVSGLVVVSLPGSQAVSVSQLHFLGDQGP